jgi:hypothetical protein
MTFLDKIGFVKAVREHLPVAAESDRYHFHLDSVLKSLLMSASHFAHANVSVGINGSGSAFCSRGR